MKALKIFNRHTVFVLFLCFFNHYGLIAQLKENEHNNQTQDWIFGDAPEPKWVIELLHGAYQNVKEDNSFIVKIPVTSSGIKYSASVDGNAEIEKDGDYLIIYPDKNYNGTILVNLNLDMSFILNVQSVNDKPDLSLIQDKRINEDEVFNIQLTATDADGDELTYGATADNDAIIKVIKNNLTVTPKENFYGPIKINLAVSDGKSTDESSFILNVDPINDPPILESILSMTKFSKNQIDLTMSGSDIDGDNLTYSVVGDGEVDFDIKDNIVIVKPKKNYKGSTPITLTTSDGTSSIDTSFTLINPIPGLSAFAPQSMLEDEILSIVLNMKDVESDSFRYKIKSTNNAKIEINGNQLSVIPQRDYFGELILNLNISDGKDSTDFSFNINVLPQADNPIAHAGRDTTISSGCNSKLFLDGSKSFDPDNDIVSYKWSILDTDEIIFYGLSGMYNFNDVNTDLKESIILTVTDRDGLISQDTITVNIINDEAPVANAGEDFIAPFNKYVQLDGSKSIDKDSKLIYSWSIISGDASLTEEEEVKKSPKFKYPSQLTEPLEFVALLKVKDSKSFCFSTDKVNITCLPNLDMADSTVSYEIVRASKEENRVYIDLNVTNKQLWPFDFAAFTLISVKDENNRLGQIDPYKGKNTVKYGIENEESVGVELVYNFESPPSEVSIICKSTMAISADSVFFKQGF